MRTLPPDRLAAQMRWRYACKKFDPRRTIPADVWAVLEESLVLSPSSFGLQPWKFVVITNPDVKAQLVPLSWGQGQVRDASHLVVFAIRKTISAEDVDRYVERIVHIRGVAAETIAGYRKVMLNFVENPPPGLDLDDWAARQVYIALGTFMTAAAVVGIDTCPLEGIEPAKYDEVLQLPQHGYATAVACAAGYRAEDDKYAQLAKVRFATEEMILRI
jgi:nitroreductase